MIDINQIESFYPPHVRYFKRNILREYLQYKILEILFDSRFSNEIVFMGGTAIRIIYDNSRFSEDLDFDNFSLTENDFRELCGLIVKKLNLFGYDVETKFTFRQAFHCHIGFINILNLLGLSGHKDEKIVIRLDTEPQKIKYTPDRKIINKFDIFTHINVVPVDILLSQKLLALLKRKRTMGRDLFDIVFLTAKTNPDFNYLGQKIGITDKTELKEKILIKCGTVNFKALLRDLEPFLINPEEKKRILLFKELIEGTNWS